MKTRIFLAMATAALACGLQTATVEAATTYYWSTANSGNWTDTANWTTSEYATGAGNTAVFRQDLTGAATVNFDTNLSIGNLAFGDTDTSTLYGWTIGNTATTMTLGTASGSTAYPTITVDAGNTATIASKLAGASSTLGFTKDGDGTLILDGINTSLTYTGDTNINAGTLQLGSAENSVVLYNSSARTINVNSGGLLKLVDRNALGGINSNPLTKVVINGGTVTSSTGTIGAFNVLQDPTFKNGGVLEVTNLCAGANPTYYVKGTINVVAGTSATASSITLASGGTGWVGIGTGGSTTGPATIFNVADVTGNSNADLIISAVIKDARDPATGAAPKAALTKTGAGTMLLTGVNTYTGSTTISEGVLSVATIGNGYVASNMGQASAGAANWTFDGGTLQYTGVTASTNRNFTLNNGKTSVFEVTSADTAFNISGTTSGATTGGLTKTGAGTLILGSTVTGALAYTGNTNINAGTLQLGATEDSYVIYTSAARTINVNSGGTLNLLYKNTLPDATAVVLNGGKLTSSTGTTGAMNIVNNLTLQNGGNLEVTKAYSTNYPTYVLKGTVTVSGTTASSITTTGSTGWISLGDGAASGAATTFNVADVNGSDAADLTITSKIRNGGSGGGIVGGLTKTGAGTLLLNASSVALAYTGDTNINAGTLQLGNTEDSYQLYDSSARTINVNSGGTLKFVFRNALGLAAATSSTKVVINGGIVTSSTGSTGAFNVLQDLTLKNGGVLEVTNACGILNPTYYVKGTLSVAAGTNTTASSITLASGGTGWVGIGTGGSTTGPATVFDVADVTGDSNDDLIVSAALKNARDPTTGRSPTASLTKTGEGTLLLDAANTYTGDTTVNAGTFTLGQNGSMLFDITNVGGDFTEILGAGTVNINGKFLLDMADVTNEGEWTIVGATANYGSTFSVALNGATDDFTPDGGDLWKYNVNVGGQDVLLTFDETSGILSAAAIPEPGTMLMSAIGMLGLIAYAWRKRK